MERDDADALADGLYAVYSNAEYRAELAGRAYEGVRARYTVAHSAARLIEVYASVITGARTGASVA